MRLVFKRNNFDKTRNIKDISKQEEFAQHRLGKFHKYKIDELIYIVVVTK